MAAKRDYYEVLGIGREADDGEIKKAYRKLAMQYHPDRNSGKKDSEIRFKEVSEAYEVLSDADKRSAYDRYGHDGLRSAFGPGGFDYARDFTHAPDLEDIFSSFFGEGGGRRRSRNGPQPGADLRFDLEIDFEEAVFGSTREISVPVNETCGTCKGSGAAAGHGEETCRQCGGSGSVISINGFFQVRQTCPVCRGTGRMITKPCSACRGAGRVRQTRRLTLHIPAGVDSGAQLRLSGSGDGGARGGPPGDLYVVLQVRPHDLYQRAEDDLVCEVPVPIDLAALGGEVEVPTLDGPARLKLDPGTENGKVYRLRGHGVTSTTGRGRGDLHVRVLIEVPVRLSANQKKLLAELSAMASEENYPHARKLREHAARLMQRKRDLAK